MDSAQPVDHALIENLLAQAQALPRQRKNFNFHERADHPCQRLLNAILPGSYVRPHRHLIDNKEEFLVALRGRLGLVFFESDGSVARTLLLEHGGPVCAVNIPTGLYHTAVALSPVVVFEAKGGPYAPHTPKELAPFAPSEDSAQAAQYLRDMEALFS